MHYIYVLYIHICVCKCISTSSEIEKFSNIFLCLGYYITLINKCPFPIDSLNRFRITKIKNSILDR